MLHAWSQEDVSKTMQAHLTSPLAYGDQGPERINDTQVR